MKFCRMTQPFLVCLAAAFFLFLFGCGEQVARTADASTFSSSVSAGTAGSRQPPSCESSKAAASQAVSSDTESKTVLSDPVSSRPAGTQAGFRTPLTLVPESAQAKASFLDDAVFIGDSVTLKLKNYVTYRRKADPGFFGKAQFLAAGSMGSGNALLPLSADSIHPLYNGEKALLEDSAAKMGAGKIYIMLGINDIAVYGIDGSARNLEKLCLRFLEKRPDAVLYIQSATPMIQEKQRKYLNNENLALYNYKVSGICKSHGWKYLDLESVMRGKDGSLKPEYCSDPNVLGLHFTDQACEVWIHYILTHTGV